MESGARGSGGTSGTKMMRVKSEIRNSKAVEKAESRKQKAENGRKAESGSRGWPSRHCRAVAMFVTICALLLTTFQTRAAETAAPVANTGIGDTNSQETVRSYLQLQEQLHATQIAIERTRREADEAAAETAKLTAARLQAIEHALSAQRAQELQAMQSSNRVMLVVSGSFASLGLAAMLFMAYFQWRTVNRLAEISAVLPHGHSLVGGS